MAAAIRVTKEGSRWVARFRFDWALVDIVKTAGFKFDRTAKYWWTTDETVAGRIDPNAAEAANRAIAASRAVTAAVTVPVPEGLAYLPYQLAGIAYATEHKDVLIGDEMGLGKTIQAIGIVNADPTIKNVLVVCPASLKINWARELAKWLVRPMTVEIANGAFPTTDVAIINYDVLGKHRAAIDARTWDLLIVDEAHYAKNEKAMRTRLLLGHEDRKNPAKTMAPIAARRRVFLTGTPIVNRPAELWTLVHALDPGGLGASFMTFMRRYTNAHHNGYGWDFTGANNLEELQTRMRARFLIRRLKTEVLKELPAKRRQIVVLPEVGEAGAVLKSERAAVAAMQARVAALREAIAKALKAKKWDAYEAAVRALKDTQEYAFAEMARLARITAVAKTPQVIEYVNNVLEAKDKVIVFCHHLEVAHALKGAFPTAALVTGEVAVGKRQTEVDRFQFDPDCRVFIGGIKAAGVGLTLTAADHVVFAELDWVPGNISQAEDRAHRIGQLNSVLVQHLVYDDSIDSRRAHMIVDKQAVIDAALDNRTDKVVAAEINEAATAPVEIFDIPDISEVPF